MAIVLHTAIRKETSPREESASVDADPAIYREFVFRCALAICGERDGAEDVAQEVLLILFKSRRQLARADDPTAWVRRVAARCATRHLKNQRPIGPLPESLPSNEDSPEALAVYQILRSLTPEQRALLGMALNQGLSYREIGEALGIPEGTVASRLSAAKKAFQRKWEQ